MNRQNVIAEISCVQKLTAYAFVSQLFALNNTVEPKGQQLSIVSILVAYMILQFWGEEEGHPPNQNILRKIKNLGIKFLIVGSFYSALYVVYQFFEFFLNIDQVDLYCKEDSGPWNFVWNVLNTLFHTFEYVSITRMVLLIPVIMKNGFAYFIARYF